MKSAPTGTCAADESIVECKLLPRNNQDATQVAIYLDSGSGLIDVTKVKGSVECFHSLFKTDHIYPLISTK